VNRNQHSLCELIYYHCLKSQLERKKQMKSKLAFLALMGALALTANATNAMASPNVGNHATARPSAVQRTNARAVSKKVGSTAPKAPPTARPGSHATK
jgi:hypothetical protein